MHTLLGMLHDDAVNSMSFDMLGGLGQQGSLSPRTDKGSKLHGPIATGHAVSTRANAHAGSRARVTSMGGLYDAATLHALLELFRSQTPGSKALRAWWGLSSELVVVSMQTK